MRDFVGHDEVEACIVAHLLRRDARVQRTDAHRLALGHEIEDAERRHHEPRAAFGQPGIGARRAAVEKAGATDEIDLGTKAPVVPGHHDVEAPGKAGQRADADGTRPAQPGLAWSPMQTVLMLPKRSVCSAPRMAKSKKCICESMKSIICGRSITAWATAMFSGVRRRPDQPSVGLVMPPGPDTHQRCGAWRWRARLQAATWMSELVPTIAFSPSAMSAQAARRHLAHGELLVDTGISFLFCFCSLVRRIIGLTNRYQSDLPIPSVHQAICFPPGSAQHTDFGFIVARIARRLRQAVDAELRLIGLTGKRRGGRSLDVRWLGDGVPQKELATAISVEGPSLVRLLDNLERRGLIERREDESDRRARGIH